MGAGAGSEDISNAVLEDSEVSPGPPPYLPLLLANPPTHPSSPPTHTYTHHGYLTACPTHFFQTTNIRRPISLNLTEVSQEDAWLVCPFLPSSKRTNVARRCSQAGGEVGVGVVPWSSQGQGDPPLDFPCQARG